MIGGRESIRCIHCGDTSALYMPPTGLCERCGCASLRADLLRAEVRTAESACCTIAEGIPGITNWAMAPPPLTFDTLHRCMDDGKKYGYVPAPNTYIPSITPMIPIMATHTLESMRGDTDEWRQEVDTCYVCEYPGCTERGVTPAAWRRVSFEPGLPNRACDEHVPRVKS